MSNKIEIVCACGCGRTKGVRTADVKRGWGRFYSKRCKAVDQERRTKQFKELKECSCSGSEYDRHNYAMSQQEISEQGF